MKKVIGNADYSVHVTCVKCNHYFNVVEQEYNNEVTHAMFTNTIKSCTNMNIEITCPECGEEMILDEITY